MRLVVRTIFATLLLAGLAAAQTKVTSVEGITEYRLDNGLQVLLFPDNSKPTVTVNVTYLVGSRHEGAGETGMAHLLEHMLYKGTNTRGDIKADLSAHGAEFNGSTSYDRTNYFETLNATADNLNWAIRMEADRMVNSRVSRQDLDSEMTVVRNEFEIGENSPTRVLMERVESTAYLWHGYGRSPIGSRSDIENVPIEKLQAFYRNYYQPDNALVVVAGKFDPTSTLTLINDTFGKIPKPTRKLQPTYTEEPVQDGEREVVLRRAGDNQMVVAAYHTPSLGHPDISALEVLDAVLTEPPAGRLYKALVDSKKATSAGGDLREQKEPGLYLLMATLRKDASLADAEKTMMDVVDGVIKEPPSKEEVERAKTRLLKEIDLALTNSTGIGLILSETASAGDWRLFFLDRDRIEKVSAEDVARVAKQYLKTSNRTIGRFLPTDNAERAEIPKTPDLAAELNGYTGRKAVDEGEVFDPTPANIEARVTRVKLPGGLNLVMLPKKSRGGVVVANMVLHFGSEKNLQGLDTTAQMTGAMLMRGTQKHTRQQLADDLDKAKIQMAVNGSAVGATAGVETVRDSFPQALRLLAEVLKTPSFPENELETIRQSSVGRIEAGRNDPQQLAMLQLRRHIAAYPVGDPRAVSNADESLAAVKAVTLDGVKKFHAGFYGANNAELAISGDFDAAEVRKLVTELFDGWKSAADFSIVKRTVQKMETLNRMTETPDKTNAALFAGTAIGLTRLDPDYPAMIIANQVFGGDLKSRMWTRIREKDGLSYSTGSALQPGTMEVYAQYLFYALVNPQNVLKAEAAFKEEMAKAVASGFTAEEVAEAKKAFLEQQIVDRSSDGGLASMLADQARFGWTMQRTSDLEAKIASLTPAQVNAAFKKWVDPAAISIFKVGDFKKAGITK